MPLAKTRCRRGYIAPPTNRPWMAQARLERLSVLMPVSLVLCLGLLGLAGGDPVVAQSNSVQVSILSTTTYSPAVITVVIGVNNTVVWKNNDNVIHTVTGANITGFNSGDIAPGASFSYTFNTPGVYPYHCLIHPTMSGAVIVKASAASTTSSGGGGIPEFPYQTVAVAIFAFLLPASYLALRRKK
jgi:plastocyanin